MALLCVSCPGGTARASSVPCCAAGTSRTARRLGLQSRILDLGGCQNYGPFLGP